MKKFIFALFGIGFIGYEKNNHPNNYLYDKGILIVPEKRKTHTHPVGESAPFNEVFNPKNFRK